MHSSQFPISALEGRPIHVAGLGALGRPIAENLFRKQVPELHLWDPDIVEARNRFNQRVYAQDIGLPKTEACIRMFREIYPDSTTRVVVHQERIVPSTTLSGIVIAAVDWNRIRYEEVLPAVIRQKDTVSFFCDGRVGMDGGKAYGVDPGNENHVYHYVEDPMHNHPDPVNGEAEAACKSDFAMPENADGVATEVLWRLTRWLHLEQGAADPYDNFVGWQFIPRRIVVTEQWDTGTARHMLTFRDGEYVDETPRSESD
jgi:hypothetical protein